MLAPGTSKKQGIQSFPEQINIHHHNNMDMINRTNKESRRYIEEGDPTAKKTCLA
jgi:hypothetical protein